MILCYCTVILSVVCIYAVLKQLSDVAYDGRDVAEPHRHIRVEMGAAGAPGTRSVELPQVQKEAADQYRWL